jgi:hypothetical protein
MDIEALFNPKEPIEAQAPVIEPPVETPVPVTEAHPAPEIAPEPTPAPEPAPEKDKSVPLPTFLDMRDRAKEAERRAAELEARNAPQTPPQQMPDPVDDPQGFAAWNDARTQDALTAQRFEMSDLMAKQQYGEEVVKTAADWAMERASTDPVFKAAYMRQPHPLDWIVREHKRSGLLNDIGDNVDDWFVREAAKRGYQPTAPELAPAPAVAATPTAAKPAVPPRSIASDAPAPNVSGDASADFMAIFRK